MIHATESMLSEVSSGSGLMESAANGLTAQKWYALYTRSRHEKVVDQELKKRKIETFLPLRKLKRHWSDRTKIVEEPLFQSYVFVHIPFQERWTVLNSFGAVSFVHFGPNLPAALPEKDINALRRFVQQDIPLDPFPYIKEGQRVSIRSGPFKGVEGFVVRKNQQCRLVILLDRLMLPVREEQTSATMDAV